MTLVEAVALRAPKSLRGTLRLPSDKSISHRALICAALAHGESEITLREPGADVLSTIGALSALGVDIRTETVGAETLVRVSGLGREGEIGRLGPGAAFCGNSGTSMRLLAGALASGNGPAALVGDESLSRRPMARVAEPLRAMGAAIELDDGHAPVTILGNRPLAAMHHDLTVASAQLVGAIAFAALAADGTTTVTVPGVVRDHTERMLSALGADIRRTTDSNGSNTAMRGPAGLRSLDLRVPGDFSSAAAWIVAAALHRDAELRLVDVGLNPTRTALIEVLRSMGAQITINVRETREGEPVGDIDVIGGRRLTAISLHAGDVAPLIDELPLICVAMASAEGMSQVRGAAELRVKESDRIATIGAALTAAGARFDELQDGWRIRAGKPLDAQVVTQGDHRIAMAMAVAAWSGVAASVELDDPECVAVSYPSFWADANLIGAKS
jgi:3-phosphoshikimate 1-carboxyvinyltransferase